MSGGVGFVWHDRYAGRGFVPRRASWSRYALAVSSFDDHGLFRQGLAVFSAPPADEREILTVHTPAYLERLRAMDAIGEGFVDGGQTPAYRGMLHRASIAVGGTVLATRLVTGGRVAHAFNPAGGLHHAHADRASGFCILNDIAVAVRDLRARGTGRIAVIDVDAHHGDGTQALFWEDDILTVSLHEHGARFFPGTGGEEERGAGRGRGFTVNVPLARGTSDEDFLRRLDVAIECVRAYRPEAVLLQFGTDGHRDDRFSHLELSDDAYVAIAERVHDFAHEACGGALVVLGGGGYAPETVARVWTKALAAIGGFRMLARDG